MNNTSMFTADRMTHLKIVVVSLVCATVVAGIGIAARVADGTAANARYEASVIKAGAPFTASTLRSTDAFPTRRPGQMDEQESRALKPGRTLAEV